MKPAGLTVVLTCRRLLQADPDTFDDGNAVFAHRNGSSIAVRKPFNPTTPFDSSMALTILIVLTALIFMGFFSIYIRRFSSSSDTSPPPSSSSSSSSDSRPTPSNQKGGLDFSTVSSLPVLAYEKAGKHQRIEDCPICLSEFQERESVKLIPYCSHVFHPRCIDTWLESHVTCPLCRSTQLFVKVEA